MVAENRSMASHRGYFAELHSAFENLAEEYADRFPSAEHLRAWALVQAGYCDESNYVLDTNKDAKQLAIMLRRKEPFSVIQVHENVVKEFSPMSQSTAAMKKAEFEASKKAVLEIVASMARTTVGELRRNAGKSA